MDWLKCSICFNTYNDSVLRPRSLICGHTFCENCLNNTIQNKTLTCPQCRKILEIHSVTDLPINYIVEGLLKSLNLSSEDVIEGAISRSIEVEGVSDGKQEEGDSLKSVLEQQQKSLSTQKELLKTSAGMCNEHSGNEMIFRCSLHKSWVCEKCIEEVGDHPKTHCSIISFKEEIENRKQEYKISLENEEKSYDEIILDIQKLISCLSKNREHHVSVADALQDLVTMHRKEGENLQSEIKSFEKMIANGNLLKQRLVEVKHKILKAETLEESNSARDMVANKKELARNWIKYSNKDIEDGKLKVKTSCILETATKRSLVYRVKLLEELSRMQQSLKIKDEHFFGHFRITIKDGKIHLHVLQNTDIHKSLPSHLQLIGEKKAPLTNNILTFLDIAWPDQKPRRIYLKMLGNTSRARQHLLLVTGQCGHSYRGLCFQYLVGKDKPQEFLITEAYDGKKASPLLDDLSVNIKPIGIKAGIVAGAVWDTDGNNAKPNNGLFGVFLKDGPENTHSGFAKVIEGLDILQDIAKLDNREDVKIVDCGVVLPW